MGFYARKRADALAKVREYEAKLAAGVCLTATEAGEYVNARTILAMRQDKTDRKSAYGAPKVARTRWAA